MGGSGGGGRYGLLYDDGDAEDDVSEGRIRAAGDDPPTRAPTAAGAAGGAHNGPKSAPADADAVLDSFLNDLDMGSDDGGEMPVYGAAVEPHGDRGGDDDDDGDLPVYGTVAVNDGGGDDDDDDGGGDYGDDFDA